MQFNKIIRGNNRQANSEPELWSILDAGSLCTIAFTHQEKAMMLPTSYGRKDHFLYFHGSTQNFMLNEILKNEQICVSVTFLDGIVLAKTLFNTSVNYRSVVLFGKTRLIHDVASKNEALKIITNQVIPGRWEEVALGTDKHLQAIMVVEFEIESASVKIRNEGPTGDAAATPTQWSGHIPLKIIALEPIFDIKRNEEIPLSDSVKNFLTKFS